MRTKNFKLALFGYHTTPCKTVYAVNTVLYINRNLKNRRLNSRLFIFRRAVDYRSIKGQLNFNFIVFRDILKTANNEILKTSFQKSIGSTRKSTNPLYSENQSCPC